MVQIIYTGENKDKITQILNAAQKRFGIYGYEKTAMHEIAADLGMSKASLYYYFPDKEHLFKAVIEREQEDFFQSIRSKIESIEEPDKMLREFILIRLDYFKTFMNLGRLRYNELKEMKSEMKELINEFNKHEFDIVTHILEKGKSKGMFKITEIEETARLLIDTIKGLRGQFIHQKEYIYINPDEYAILEKKMGHLTDIFIKGITN